MQSDNHLIRKIKRQQNKEAAGILVERYYREIYSYVYRQMGNREDAMDITQEIFIAILQGIGSFQEKKASFRTWAYRVASNKITDYYRSSGYRGRGREVAFLPGEEGVEYSGVTAGEYGSVSEKSADIEQLIVDRETIRHVMTVVAGFDIEWVRIFQKKCFEEKTFAEIAEELGGSVNTVKTRFYTMLKKVRQEVGFR